MEQGQHIPVLIIGDERGRAFLSIELSPQPNRGVRIFSEFSGRVLSPRREDVERLREAVLQFEGEMALFEDKRSSVMSGLLKRLGYHGCRRGRAPRGTRVSWSEPCKDTPCDQLLPFGVDESCRLGEPRANRRMTVHLRRALVGELTFTDFGRFVRIRANRYGFEGLGRAAPGEDPSLIMLALRDELRRERKRYLILAQEYSPFAGELDPYPLWHMVLHNPEATDHSCRPALDSDMKTLAMLTSEYEDSTLGEARSRVLSYHTSPNFKYLIGGNGEGFALLKFAGDDEGMLHDLYVFPGSQGRGIGDDLVRGSVDELSSRCTKMHLNTIYHRAKRLYEKHGFRTEYTDLCVALQQRTMSRGSR